MFGGGGVREKERACVCVSVCVHTRVCAGHVCDLIFMLKQSQGERHQMEKGK